ncbi:Thymidylate synthase [Fukomys damarensis]|uniref:Thymidylate synthase n=1 Tax=Fukomys damarensis TaxID=885580 RepID=A0A091E2A0_FUKDA|nr:Thymidylate synthase [Fukomys damarensis]
MDQLQKVINTIKTNPDDRRLIMCTWNPKELPLMALPPCHALYQFYVVNWELYCPLYQLSVDMDQGLPFKVSSYTLLTYIVAPITGLQTGDFVHIWGDAHIYLNRGKLSFSENQDLSQRSKSFEQLRQLMTSQLKTLIWKGATHILLLRWKWLFRAFSLVLLEGRNSRPKEADPHGASLRTLSQSPKIISSKPMRGETMQMTEAPPP